MLCLIRAKACKKCGGDLSLECDIYGTYIQCIQCGANYNQEDVPALPARIAGRSLKAVRAVKAVKVRPKALAGTGRRT